MLIRRTHRYSFIHTPSICTSSNRPVITVRDIPLRHSLWHQYRRFPCTSACWYIPILFLFTFQSNTFLRKERKIRVAITNTDHAVVQFVEAPHEGSIPDSDIVLPPVLWSWGRLSF
jgi:hypothetical protein